MLPTETSTTKFSLYQISILGIGSILVLTLTFFGDRTVLQSNKKINASETKQNPNQDGLIPAFSSAQMQDMERKLNEKLSQVELPSQKMEVLDALVSLGMNNERPDIAAKYSIELQKLDSSEAIKMREALLFKQSADLYEGKDSTRFLYWNGQAAMAYQNLSLKNPSDLNIQLEALIRKVKSSKGMEIMTNIQEIKSLADKNPKFTQAQIQLGLFAMQSNQLERAKGRFLKVLQINPTDEWSLYYLSEIYQRLNQQDSVTWYQTEVQRVAKDPKLKAKIQIKH